MTSISGLEIGSFDCRDAAALAAFWSGVLQRPVDDGATAAYATIGFDEPGPTWMFVHSDGLGAGRKWVELRDPEDNTFRIFGPRIAQPCDARQRTARCGVPATVPVSGPRRRAPAPEIARELFLSKKTVETHIRNMFRKLHASSRVDIARAMEAAVDAGR
jgi:hypothetical protein